jgi:hypothetical protein
VIKYYKLIIKTFDQLKNDNFDQLKFDQVIVSRDRDRKKERQLVMSDDIQLTWSLMLAP